MWTKYYHGPHKIQSEKPGNHICGTYNNLKYQQTDPTKTNQNQKP